MRCSQGWAGLSSGSGSGLFALGPVQPTCSAPFHAQRGSHQTLCEVYKAMERHSLGVHDQNGIKWNLRHSPGDCLVHTCGCHAAIGRLLARGTHAEVTQPLSKGMQPCHRPVFGAGITPCSRHQDPPLHAANTKSSRRKSSAAVPCNACCGSTQT